MAGADAEALAAQVASLLPQSDLPFKEFPLQVLAESQARMSADARRQDLSLLFIALTRGS